MIGHRTIDGELVRFSRRLLYVSATHYRGLINAQSENTFTDYYSRWLINVNQLGIIIIEADSIIPDLYLHIV